jgi:RNA polymerase sigma-70 factor (ECF subfamily)
MQGNREVFGPLIRRYERELYGYLCRYVGDEDLAADVFQNTCVAVFTKIRQYERGRPARPWLYAIATNQAIDALRKQARRGDRTTDRLNLDQSAGESGRGFLDLIAASEADPAELVEGEELRQRVRTAIATLPESLRQVVLLAYFQGLKYQDIAEALEIPVGTVKSRMHAAIARLAQAWDEIENPQETGS